MCISPLSIVQGVFWLLGICDYNAFGLLRDDLCRACREWDVPWCVGGDFNVVRYLEERLGAFRLTRHMKQFNCFIEELELVDLPLNGAEFTWTGRHSPWVSIRLDRFLFSGDWMELDTRLIQEAMTNPGLDHIPIILRPIHHSFALWPFKFEIMWLEVPEFVGRLKEWWKEEVEEGSASYMFAQKMRLVKQ